MAKILHLGFPKAASSSLQAYFRDTGGAQYLGKLGADAAYVTPRVRRIHAIQLPYARKEIDIAEARAAIQSSAGNGPYILSEERLSGVGFATIRQQPRPLLDVMRVLRQIHGDDSIFVLVFRAQWKLLASYYPQMVKFGYCAPFRTFLERQGTGHADSIAGGLQYGNLLEQMHDEGFNVHPLLMEEMVNGIAPFAAFLTGLGLRPPDALPRKNERKEMDVLVRRLNRNRKGLGNHPELFADDRENAPVRATESDFTAISPGEEQRVKALFADGNRKLGALLGREVAGHGY